MKLCYNEEYKQHNYTIKWNNTKLKIKEKGKRYVTKGVPLDTKLPCEETLQGGVLSLACLTLCHPTGWEELLEDWYTLCWLFILSCESRFLTLGHLEQFPLKNFWWFSIGAKCKVYELKFSLKKAWHIFS